MLTVAQVAERLQVLRAWVYRHKDELRGYQPARRSALRFSDLIIKEIMEGTHAISGKKWEMASIEDDRWPEEDEGLPARRRSGGAKVGGRSVRRRLAKAGRDPYGLLD